MSHQLRLCSGAAAVKKFQRDGWVVNRQVGSHVMLTKAGYRYTLSVPQLTLYALMLSRLTGLRLYDFKCAWFDENSYFEFFPLHVVYKLRDRSRKEHPDQMKFEEMTELSA